MEIILFLAIFFLITFIVGRLLEKIRVPWIFSALLIGLGLAAYNPFPQVTNSDSFALLSQLGMYFLLFIIGLELDIKNILKQGKFVAKMTLGVILVETFFGTILVHYVFNINWLISLLVASSFATVGEAVLLPILDEFKLIKTKLGQTILGIGALDDVVEVLTIIAASILLGQTAGHSQFSIGINLLILGLLFGLVFLMSALHKHINSFKFKDIPSFFLFVLFFLFLFIGIGMYVESAALGALLAGIAIKNIIPKKRLKIIDSEVRVMAYGLFAPMFFLSVGLDTDITYLIQFPFLVLLVMLMTKTSKIVTSYLLGKKELGTKKSVLLGISLCVKFSTSIVIIKLLYDMALIPLSLYSVLIGTTIAFKFFVPILLAYLIPKWKISTSKT